MSAAIRRSCRQQHSECKRLRFGFLHLDHHPSRRRSRPHDHAATRRPSNDRSQRCRQRHHRRTQHRRKFADDREHDAEPLIRHKHHPILRRRDQQHHHQCTILDLRPMAVAQNGGTIYFSRCRQVPPEAATTTRYRTATSARRDELCRPKRSTETERQQRRPHDNSGNVITNNNIFDYFDRGDTEQRRI